jgi:hypothetical protein
MAGITNFDFGIGGKEYKTIYDCTTTWTTAGDNTWDSVAKANGKVLPKSHRQLSADGKILTITETGTRPDGTSFKDETVYTRVTGTTGLVGKWRSTKVTISARDNFVVSSPSPGIMHGDIPAYKESVQGKADGTDLPITGPMHLRASLSHSSKSLPAKSLTLSRATENQTPTGSNSRRRWQVIHRRFVERRKVRRKGHWLLRQTIVSTGQERTGCISSQFFLALGSS